MPSALFEILLKGSNEPNKVPLAADLKHKELAVNFSDGILFTKKADNSIAKFLDSSQLSFTLSRTLSSSTPQYGSNTLGISGTNGSILGGTNNQLNHSNCFILGSNLSTAAPNYTYVNNLSASSKIETGELFVNSPNGTKWQISVSNTGVISAIDTNSLVTYYWYGGEDNDWFNVNNWYTDIAHNNSAGALPTSANAAYVVGPVKPVADLDVSTWVDLVYIDVSTFGMEISGTNKTVATSFRGTGSVSFFGSVTITNP